MRQLFNGWRSTSLYGSLRSKTWEQERRHEAATILVFKIYVLDYVFSSFSGLFDVIRPYEPWRGGLSIN